MLRKITPILVVLAVIVLLMSIQAARALFSEAKPQDDQRIEQRLQKKPAMSNIIDVYLSELLYLRTKRIDLKIELARLHGLVDETAWKQIQDRPEVRTIRVQLEEVEKLLAATTDEYRKVLDRSTTPR